MISSVLFSSHPLLIASRLTNTRPYMIWISPRRPPVEKALGNALMWRSLQWFPSARFRSAVSTHFDASGANPFAVHWNRARNEKQTNIDRRDPSWDSPHSIRNCVHGFAYGRDWIEQRGSVPHWLNKPVLLSYPDIELDFHWGSLIFLCLQPFRN